MFLIKGNSIYSIWVFHVFFLKNWRFAITKRTTSEVLKTYDIKFKSGCYYCSDSLFTSFNVFIICMCEICKVKFYKHIPLSNIFNDLIVLFKWDLSSWLNKLPPRRGLNLLLPQARISKCKGCWPVAFN